MMAESSKNITHCFFNDNRKFYHESFFKIFESIAQKIGLANHHWQGNCTCLEVHAVTGHAQSGGRGGSGGDLIGGAT